jgi:hypothetical protein
VFINFEINKRVGGIYVLLLKNGFVLNNELGQFEQKDVLVQDGVITKISENIEAYCEIVDCTNQFLIPGLIDMHVHIKKQFAPYFTAAGITTVRNTAGSVLELNEMMQAPMTSITPQVISADRMMDGPPGLWGDESPYNINIDEEQAAREEVKRQVNLGADFIKIYGWLSKEIMEVVVDEASKFGREVSTDILYATKVNAIDAAQIGITWLEHASGVIQAMYPNWNAMSSEELFKEIPWHEPDEQKIQAVCKELLNYNVKLCPTLTLYDQFKRGEHYWKPNHEVVEHALSHTSLEQQWAPNAAANHGQKQFGVQMKTVAKIAYEYAKLGGVVVTGTDTPAGIYTYPGIALHRELQLFVEAGFTPFEALMCATEHAAQSLHIENLGAIKQGYIANIVRLTDNPLEQIEHTMSVHSVMKGGVLYTPQEIFNTVPSSEEMNSYYEQLLQLFKEHNLPVPM